MIRTSTRVLAGAAAVFAALVVVAPAASAAPAQSQKVQCGNHLWSAWNLVSGTGYNAEFGDLARGSVLAGIDMARDEAHDQTCARYTRVIGSDITAFDALLDSAESAVFAGDYATTIQDLAASETVVNRARATVSRA
jgi:hypothetical protein